MWGHTTCQVQVIPPSSATGCLFFFSLNNGLRKTQTIQELLSFRRADTCCVRVSANLPCPGTPSPLLSLFLFSYIDENLAKPKNKEMVTCFVYKNIKGNMTLLLLPYKRTCQGQAVHARVYTCVLMEYIFFCHQRHHL